MMYNPKYDKFKIDTRVQAVDKLNCNKCTISKTDFENFLHERSEYAECYPLVQKAIEKSIGDNVDEDFILQLQRVIVPEYPGYRDKGAKVERANKEIYRAPVAQCTKQYLCNLIEWFNNARDLHIAVKAAIFHYEFVKIHPFADGNGHTIRLIILLMFVSKGYDLTHCSLLIDYFKNNKEEYYNALADGTSYKFDADLTTWIEYFCSTLYKTNCKA